MKSLRITINNKGQVEVEVNGVQGSSCLDLTKFLEEALGPVNKSCLKNEFYETDTSQSWQAQIQ